MTGCPAWCAAHRTIPDERGGPDYEVHAVTLFELVNKSEIVLMSLYIAHSEGSDVPPDMVVQGRGDIPVTLGTVDAAALAAGIKRGQEIIDGYAPARCKCGQAMRTADAQCWKCDVGVETQKRRERRQRMSVVEQITASQS